MAAISTPAAPGTFRHQLGGFWKDFSASRGALVGLIFIALIFLVALLAPWVAPHDPALQDRSALLVPPVWHAEGSWRYILGTDAVGRDILSRLIYGARYSLSISAMVVLISMCGGIFLGLLAGYFRGWVETVITRVMDVVLAFPSLLLALGLVAILSPGLTSAMIAIALVQLPYFVRLTRAAVIGEKSREYVTASRLAGAGHMRLMFNTLLPNCMAPLIVQATLSFSTAILDIAALGFLGMGVQPPTPEWGAMLANAREFMGSAYWAVTFPGLVILLTVLMINLMGDGLRDALDPKMKRS
ncbi:MULTISPECIES: ABC transporter permease subunit [unclassified Salinicola]|uniref:ABC transporter permease subunit n=1 Tax=unclassified Salinicola TaxID=2634022 RepID=UPI0004E6B8DE|nr:MULTISPECIES: ABC transporter permease subunit [unclassified Salinicola]KFF49388.1 peptide transporter [Gammaproteobacteria bacterium MFB021]MCE3028662.1 ABC transporter permease subunit [Salinicola sp. DM10]WIX32434.1 ABC transporter permease subunit [Salinicola sp. JS01]